MHAPNGFSAEEAMAKLKAGNARFCACPGMGDLSSARRQETLANGQHPYAVIFTCADARVIPEAIFSAGLGDLFVIRAAGNAVGPHTLASMEYAVDHLGCRLIVVLGHEACGAVAAALTAAPKETSPTAYEGAPKETPTAAYETAPAGTQHFARAGASDRAQSPRDAQTSSIPSTSPISSTSSIPPASPIPSTAPIPSTSPTKPMSADACLSLLVDQIRASFGEARDPETANFANIRAGVDVITAALDAPHRGLTVCGAYYRLSDGTVSWL